MKPPKTLSPAIKSGLSADENLLVGPENQIIFADDRMPAVLATPWLIAHMEYAARKAIAPYLAEGERSVGVTVDIEHLAAAPVGDHVTCRAKVILVNAPFVTFAVEAFDEMETLARGVHKRAVIDVDRFRSRLIKKAEKIAGQTRK
ncbi:MAG: thioesterase family protein [Planctomycetota bacterium]